MVGQAQQAKGHSTTKQLADLKANMGRSEAAKKALEERELELRLKLAAQAGTLAALQADVAAKSKLADEHAHSLIVQVRCSLQHQRVCHAPRPLRKHNFQPCSLKSCRCRHRPAMKPYSKCDSLFPLA